MRKFTISILSLILIGFTLQAQTVIVSEDFQSGSLPATWTQETNATDGGWLVGNATAMSSAYFEIPDHTIFAATNDDECNCDKSNDFLKTEAYDLSSISTAVLAFDYYYYAATYQGSTEEVILKLSTDAGTTWMNIDTLAPSAWSTYEVDFSAYAGNSSVMLGWHYNDGGGWLYGMALDNFTIYEPVSEDAAILGVDLLEYYAVGSYDMTVAFKNLGSNAITSLDVNYSINGGAAVTYSATGLNIGMLDMGMEVHGTQLPFTTAGNYDIKVWLSNPNGTADLNNANDTLEATVIVVANSSDRKVIIEHWTQASCAPCASQNPALDALITDPMNADKVVHIAYHTSWPGSDEMYDFNDGLGLGDARTDYYGVTGVPNCVIAGNRGQGLPSVVTQAAIDAEYARAGLALFTGNISYSEETMEITVDMEVEPYIDLTNGDYAAHVVLVQDTTYASAPGSNGETYFPDVMRYMFAGVDGEDVTGTTVGSTADLEYTWTVPSEVHINACKVIVFLQRNDDKFMLMADEMDIEVIPFTPNESIEVTFNVDISAVDSFDFANDVFYMAGSLAPVSSWEEPGTNTDLMLTDADNDQIYTLTLTLDTGEIQFKFFRNAGWDGGEWAGDPNRMAHVVSDTTLNFIWGPDVNVEENLLGNVTIYPNPSNGLLNITNAQNSDIYIYNILGTVVGVHQVSETVKTIDLTELANGSYTIRIVKGNNFTTKQIILNK